jgi:hypothetical protein
MTKQSQTPPAQELSPSEAALKALAEARKKQGDVAGSFELKDNQLTPGGR